MNDRPEYLILGGDSKIGRYSCDLFRERGVNFITSTRRRSAINKNRILFDFEEPETYQLPEGIKHAFVLAAANGYEHCATDPNSYNVNVEYIPRAIIQLMKQGVFVTYMSTNSVFGGDLPWPQEDAPHAPTIPYSQQKSESEKNLRRLAKEAGLLDNYNILRITKIIELNTPPIPDWLSNWEKGEIITPFKDLTFAPMSPHYVANALLKIKGKRIAGNFHLSGAENITYEDMAVAIANKRNVPLSLVQAINSTDVGVELAYQPKYSALSMENATKELGLVPQKLDEMIDDIF